MDGEPKWPNPIIFFNKQTQCHSRTRNTFQKFTFQQMFKHQTNNTIHQHVKVKVKPTKILNYLKNFKNSLKLLKIAQIDPITKWLKVKKKKLSWKWEVKRVTSGLEQRGQPTG